VATPVGGLVEQVAHNVTGVVAKSATVSAFADAIRTLAENRGLLAQLRRGIVAQREDRPIERFVNKICDIALCRRNYRLQHLSIKQAHQGGTVERAAS